jgi:tellurite resistance protein
MRAPTPAPGLWRRTPPAIFPAVLGLFGLGHAWRRGAEAFGLPGGPAELILGAVTLLYLFCLVAWLAKPLRRPGVIVEELRVLPGRAGLAAMSLSMMMLAATLVPYSRGLATVVALVAFATHAGLAALVARLILTGPEEARSVTPVWHLTFVGFIFGPLAGIPLGFETAARLILFAMIPAALGIWSVSLWQLFNRVPPAPLRPLLAIHLAPASLFATVAGLLGLTQLALGFLALAAVILIALLATGRWITEAGFSPLWAAFTFPLAAFTSALFVLAPAAEPLRLAGAVALATATLVIPVIAYKVLQAWAKGGLAARTNAAQV